MKVSKALLSAMMFFMASQSGYAAVLSCVSTDKAHVLNVSIDEAAKTITVNGDKRSLHAPGKNAPKNVLLVSDPYNTYEHGEVYISYSTDKDGKKVISQIGAVDNKETVSFTLDCS
jgi:hypothetical protein